VRKVRYLSNKN